MKRTIAIIALSVLVANSAIAEDKPTSLILPTDNAHIYVNSERIKQLAPQLKSPILSLGGAPTYDLREFVTNSGISLGPEDVAIYSADSKLMYVRTSAENAEMIRCLYVLDHCGDLPAALDVDLTVQATDSDKKPLSTIAELHFATTSGTTAEIGIKHQGEERRLSLELIVGPDGKAFDFSLTGKLPLVEEDISLSLHSTGKLGKPVTAFEQADNASGGKKLQVQVKASRRLTDEQKELTPEKLALKLKAVEQELRR